jgi:hypothetical protein
VDNFLAASGLIVQRLRDESVAAANKIRPAPSAAWVTKNALDGSVNVIFFDDVPDLGQGGQSQRGKIQSSEQFWLVVVSAKNVADAGNAARQDAGIILLHTLIALQGHRLSPEHSELHRQKTPYRATDDNGFAHLPVLFSTKIITTGSAVPW